MCGLFKVLEITHLIFVERDHGVFNVQQLIKGRRSSLRANGYPYLVPNCVCGRHPAVGLLFILCLWQDLHSGHRETLHSANPSNTIKKSENPLRGSTFCAASLCRTAHQMMGLGHRVRDPQSLMKGGKPRGNIPGSDCGRVCRSGAEVLSTRRRSPWVNLRRSLRVGA